MLVHSVTPAKANLARFSSHRHTSLRLLGGVAVSTKLPLTCLTIVSSLVVLADVTLLLFTPYRLGNNIFASLRLAVVERIINVLRSLDNVQL